ncbi:hypothetical protein DUNSADRAFT_15619 [Dunaliella salina]|uniref:HMA domain-containing protein n=1 Tax=Dunaliella salina TaxID=3046 RepID=A0ABQ7H1M3_DUNSA|nr:hypothetical protein DUNSADRAFT_15619 [Dunaliella salina]|eukprot:KAF5840761.1 hypothetical protein DUNSADRAFT_15619 [Dunaliella salina]
MAVQSGVFRRQCIPLIKGVVCRAVPRPATLSKPFASQRLRTSASGSTNPLLTEKSRLAQTRFPERKGVQVCATPSPEQETDNVEIGLKVGGMMCEGCTSRVTEALQKCESVARVEVSLEKGSAAVWVQSPSQPEALSLAPKLAEAVKAIGFEAAPQVDGV